MQDDDLRAVVERWFAMLRSADLSAVDDVCADPYIRHTSLGTERLTIAQYKQRLVQHQRVLRNAVTTIDDLVVDGDKVWTRATSRGVNLEAESANVLTWLTIHRIENDKVAETWVATVPGVDWETAPR